MFEGPMGEIPKDAAKELEILHEARDIMEAGKMDVRIDGSVGIWLQPLLVLGSTIGIWYLVQPLVYWMFSQNYDSIGSNIW